MRSELSDDIEDKQISCFRANSFTEVWNVTLMTLIWAFPKIKTDNIILLLVYQIYSRKIVARIVKLAIASRFSLMKKARA